MENKNKLEAVLSTHQAEWIDLSNSTVFSSSVIYACQSEKALNHHLISIKNFTFHLKYSSIFTFLCTFAEKIRFIAAWWPL